LRALLLPHTANLGVCIVDKWVQKRLTTLVSGLVPPLKFRRCKSTTIFPFGKIFFFIAKRNSLVYCTFSVHLLTFRLYQQPFFFSIYDVVFVEFLVDVEVGDTVAEGFHDAVAVLVLPVPTIPHQHLLPPVIETAQNLSFRPFITPSG
jgi:hypothetical protein